MAKSVEVFTVFYAWQSDTPPNHCRYLIRDALDEAAEKLNASEDVQYRVNIDQDTQNEPGLCDIPATLLAKIQNAGAVVADLTYIAKTEKSQPNFCSNPNVLFELGFAFHAIGYERIVCVMNEAHGPRSEQIFDLGHRRHPIPFKSPEKSKTRTSIAAKLADALVDALRPIIALGPRNLSGDAAVRHAEDRASISAVVESRSHIRGGNSTLTFDFHPANYRERRWPNAPARERSSAARIPKLHNEFPPQQRGTAAMQWGIYNDTYGEPWAMTYAGQFWMCYGVCADHQGPSVSERIQYSSPEPTKGSQLGPGEWISFASIRAIYDTFAFVASLASEFHDREQLVVSLTGAGLAGKWLGFSHPIPDEAMGPCISPGFSRTVETTSTELRALGRLVRRVDGRIHRSLFKGWATRCDRYSPQLDGAILKK